MVLRWEDFAAVRVNWQDKAANMAALAAELNLGVDSFVFVDDSSFEIELVRAAFPGIARLACSGGDLETPGAASGLPRPGPRQLDPRRPSKAEMYAQERQRKQVPRAILITADDYLARLGLKLTIERFDAARHGQRAAQLMQKTNQFNLNDAPPFREGDLADLDRSRGLDLSRLAQGPVRRLWHASPWRSSGWTAHMAEIDSFLMSCRAIEPQGRNGVCSAFFSNVSRNSGFGKVRASFLPTEKNRVAADFLPEHGFTCRANKPGKLLNQRETGVPLADASITYEEIRLDDRDYGPTNRKVFHDLFGIPPERCGDDMSMETVKGWDSVTHLTLVFALEEAFHMQFRRKTSRS